MKVALISLYADIQSVGVRLLSACLKQAGHQTVRVFLWCPTNVGKNGFDFLRSAQRDAMVAELARLLSDTDLIGISLMSEHVFRARFLTAELRQHLSAPIIWGGVHPTIRPEECLQYADMVCVGEGEHALPELARRLEQGERHPEVPGIWHRLGHTTVSSAPWPLVQNLDDLPAPDYEVPEAYVLDEDQIKPLTPELVQKYMQLELYDLPGDATYGIVSSRGCPYNCTFCSTSYFRRLHGAAYKVRLRSIDSVVAELAWAKKAFPWITGVRFHDDTFMARTEEDLTTFSERYPSMVGLPFACYAHPVDVREKKLALLCDAGMRKLGMGIQTGSQRLQKLYKRRTPNERILDAATMLHRFEKQLMPPWFDVIVDEFNGTEDDAIETFALLDRLPQPCTLHVYSMVLWPGTELYERARERGSITDDEEQVYRASYNVLRPNYLAFVYYCYKHRHLVPRALRRFLSQRRVVHALNSPRLEKVFSALLGFLRTARHGFLPAPSHQVNQ